MCRSALLHISALITLSAAFFAGHAEAADRVVIGPTTYYIREGCVESESLDDRAWRSLPCDNKSVMSLAVFAGRLLSLDKKGLYLFDESEAEAKWLWLSEPGVSYRFNPFISMTTTEDTIVALAYFGQVWIYQSRVKNSVIRAHTPTVTSKLMGTRTLPSVAVDDNGQIELRNTGISGVQELIPRPDANDVYLVDENTGASTSLQDTLRK